MNTMNKKMVDFIRAQTVASICINDNQNRPYCFSCFYAFDDNKHLLIFKTSRTSFHGQLLKPTARLAGNIQQDKLNRLAIQGVQFTAEVVDSESSIAKNSQKLYYEKFPLAIALPGEIFTMALTWVKFTDNTLGFGTKLLWEREPDYAVLNG